METPEKKIAKAQIKSDERLALKRFKAENISTKQRIKLIQQDPLTRIQPLLTREQNMLQELFNGEPTFGTGRNLPFRNMALESGGGLIKSGDLERKTGRMFGLKF